MTFSARLTHREADRLVLLAGLVAFVLSLFLVARSQAGGDQLNLLARGYLLVANGQWISYGNPMSTGGKAPGGITSLLVGAPLFLWRDHHAASLLVALFHAAAFLLLDRVLRRIVTPAERVLFAVLYGLNPWRLFFSGFLWNPGYLFLFAAVHLWACFGQRERPRFWHSLALVAGLGLAAQLHPSTLLLGVATLLLLWRGYFKLHWGATVAGTVIAALPLVPWYFDVAAHPEILTEADKGFLGRGLVLVFPLLRGLLYWLRYPSFALADRVTHYDFSATFGGADRWLAPLVSTVVQVLGVSILLPLLANVWLLRRGRRLWRRLPVPAVPERGGSRRLWLRGYAAWTLAAAVAVFALSPTTVMMWQGVLLIHAAVLVPVLWLGLLARRRRTAPWVARLVPVAAVLSFVLVIATGLGSPQYRCGGREAMVFPLASSSPMFEELGLQRTCRWTLDRPESDWWPDVLPREERR
jgi:hypothetical protein